MNEWMQFFASAFLEHLLLSQAIDPKLDHAPSVFEGVNSKATSTSDPLLT